MVLCDSFIVGAGERERVELGQPRPLIERGLARELLVGTAQLPRAEVGVDALHLPELALRVIGPVRPRSGLPRRRSVVRSKVVFDQHTLAAGLLLGRRSRFDEKQILRIEGARQGVLIVGFENTGDRTSVFVLRFILPFHNQTTRATSSKVVNPLSAL